MADFPDVFSENTPEETSTIKKFQQKLEYSKQAKSVFHNKWNKHLKMYKGEQWHEGLASHRPKTVHNMVFTMIESELPLLMDRDPSILIKPQTSADIESAAAVNDAINHVWNSISMNKKTTSAVRDSGLFGQGIFKVFWDTEKYNGMGEIGVEVCDSFDVFVDLNATSPEELEYIIYRTRTPLRKLKKRFPDKAQLIKSNSEAQYDDSVRPREDASYLKGQDVADVYEYWYWGENGRPWVMTITNNVVLEDKESPFTLDKFPFVFLYCSKINGQLWGISNVEVIRPLQEELNKYRQVLMENTLKTTNTVWIMDRNAGVKENTITDRPGQVITVNPGTRLERMAPMGMPSHIFNQIDNVKQAIEETLGVTEVARGLTSSGATSAAAIDILTQNGTSRLKSRLKNIEFAVQELGEWFISLMTSYYDEPRMIRLTDDLSREYHFTTFDASHLKSDEVTTDPKTGEQKTITYITQFDVNILAGSSMLLNKASRYQQALELFRSGALDLESLLEYAELKDAKKVVERLVKYGVVADPNSPKVTADSILKELSKTIKFNVSSSDPMVVHDAINSLIQKAQAGEQEAIQAVQVDSPQQQAPQPQMTPMSPMPPQAQPPQPPLY